MKRTRSEKIRLGFILVMIMIFFTAITVRLVHYQVVLADEYLDIVDRQSTSRVPIPATRGIIHDRNGRVIADNVYLSSLYAYPENERELKQISKYLERQFRLPSGSAKKRYGLTPGKFRWIKRKISDQLSDRISKSAPAGLYLRQETQRQYPFGLVGKQILGFTDIDNRGQSGFEYSFDSVLAGMNGWADIRRDGLRNIFRVNESALVKPVTGKSVVLTIDMRLQETVEEELRLAVREYNAKSGMAAFIDCRNGDILAMAHYDTTEGRLDKPVKLRVVTDMFEPGSVFKAFTVAALLDSGLVDFNDSVYCEKGKWRTNGRYLRDDKELEWLTFREVIELSSNIGVAKYALELGGEEVLHAARQFGLGQKLLGSLPGETAGKISPPSRWSEYNTAALSIGHSIATSTLQLAVGFAAIANGGELLRPRLVLGWVDEKGRVIRDSEREVLGQALKSASADTLRAILRGVVERGTAEAANSSVMSIAGKTGTAQIFDMANRRYFRSKYMSSFAGFFPAEQPVVAGVVVLEEPQPVHYGGWTAGPTFRRISERFAVLNPDGFSSPDRIIPETSEQIENTVKTPDLMGYDVALADTILNELGITFRCNSRKGRIVWQYPHPDRIVFNGDLLLAVVNEPKTGEIKMIDLSGLSIREAAAFGSFANITYRIDGHGKVVKQSITPGTKVTGGNICWLTCRPT